MSRRFSLVVILLSVFCLPANLAAFDLDQVVGQVSESHYRQFHTNVENSGLGLYGGSSYNQGYRGRDGNAGDGSLGNQEARLYLQDSFASFGLDVSVQGTYKNVVGELRGKTNPDRIFIIGAHYDTTSGGDRPGGDDNASGTAAVLEAARVLSQYEFDATIRFIGFNAEEDGLLGSRDYVDNYVIPNNQNVVGMINLDMILRPAFDSGNQAIDLDLSTRTSNTAAVDLAEKFINIAAEHAPTLQIDDTIANLNGGSDQDSFARRGIAAFLASENTASEIWGGSNDYYHTTNDASDRLANDPNSPSGVTYDFAFATDVTRASVGLLASEAGLHASVPEPGTVGMCILLGSGALIVVLRRRKTRVALADA